MSQSTFTPTPEQSTALDLYRQGGSLRLIAGAGTGKTSTLRLLAEHTPPGQRLLYMAYNKAIQLDAQREFPRNTTVVTSHALAYRAVGRRYRQRLNGPRVPARQVADMLRITHTQKVGDKVLLPPQLARLANLMVSRFCISADPGLLPQHLPPVNGIAPGPERDELTALLLPHARAIWEDLQRPTGRFRFEHDHYLKLYALTNPVVAERVILYDEAQDATPVTANLVHQWQNAGKQVVIVGDSSQAIYGWRGAVDSMGMFNVPNEATLSKSFRFGPSIAAEANKWLTLLDAPIRLSGHTPIPSRLAPTMERPDAVLCRSNMGAITELMKQQTGDTSTAIVGGGAELRALAKAAEELSRGGGTMHPDLCAFRSWGEVREYAQTEEGADLSPFVDVIDSYGAATVVAVIDACVDERDADVAISTAHKSKGREWDRVKIADDFRAPHGDDLLAAEELMLSYVAVTRARKELDRGPLGWVDRFSQTGANAPRPAPVAPTAPAPVADQDSGGWQSASSVASDMRPVKSVFIGDTARALRELSAADHVTPQQWLNDQIARAAASSRAVREAG